MADPNEIGKARVVYKIPNMERANIRKDLTYKSVDGNELKMDIYYPADHQSSSLRPAVIFVHGDGPAEMLRDAKDWGQYVSWGQLIAASGFIAVTFNHRSSERFSKIYQVASDIDDLINYVRTNGESLNIDKDSIGIWVCSAGVPFGMRAAMREAPAFVRCIIAYYGFMNLQHMRDALPAEVTDEDLREFSAVYHLSKRPKEIAPMFIVKAGLDHPRLNESIDYFVMEASAKNATLNFLSNPEGQHAFDILDDNARSREIIRATLEGVRDWISKK